MQRRTLMTAAGALLLTGLTGCGFQLRGQLEVPEHLRQLSLVQHAQNHRLTASLIETLRLNQLEVSTQAPYRLELLKVVENRRTVTLDRAARVDEYELTLRIDYQVTNRQAQLVLTPQTLSTERVYTYDANAATAAAEQEVLLKQEMADDLARQLVRRYLTIKPTE